MLEIYIPEVNDFYDEEIGEFITAKAQTIQLEHSLISISKWEEKWHVPYFSKKESKTPEQALDYIRCMTINKNIDPRIYRRLTSENIEAIDNYISDEHTATWFSDAEKEKKIKNGGRAGTVITSEIIYYWMIAYQIPVEFEKWHINRLITLIRICEEKNQPPKKMSKSEIMSKNRALNEARRRALKTKG